MLSNGLPSQIIEELVLDQKVRVCLSDAILDEYFDVLSRPKFAKIRGFKSKVDIVLTVLDEIAEKYSPSIKVGVIKDKDDNKFLELALVSKADAIITGNTADFTMNDFEGTKIMTPREYWEYYHNYKNNL
jgi:uncharacterized protein